MRLYEIPFSTNVERVTLALAFKGLQVEHVAVDPADRDVVVELSGQPLVPVLVLDGGEAVADSTAILRRLDDDHPHPPLWPDDAARAAEIDVFADWFNRVWKVAPNAIADEGGTEEHWAALREHLTLFECLLTGRPFLFGDALTAADVLAFPFLKYAAHIDPADDERFHQVLHEGQPLDAHPALAAWISRMDRLPRA
jgi:glutathione S-transferase